MPRGIKGSGTRTRTRHAPSVVSTAGTTALLEPTAAVASTGQQIKPLLGLSTLNYDFAVINGTYQAVMQQGQAWVPVTSIPAFIVAQWLMQTGLLKPIGFMNGVSPGRATRSTRGNRGKSASEQISTGNRV